MREDVAMRVRVRDCHCCQICDADKNVGIFYIRPLDTGGMDIDHNAILLCGPCRLGVETAYHQQFLHPEGFFKYLENQRRIGVKR